MLNVLSANAVRVYHLAHGVRSGILCQVLDSLLHDLRRFHALALNGIDQRVAEGVDTCLGGNTLAERERLGEHLLSRLATGLDHNTRHTLAPAGTVGYYLTKFVGRVDKPLANLGGNDASGVG